MLPNVICYTCSARAGSRSYMEYSHGMQEASIQEPQEQLPSPQRSIPTAQVGELPPQAAVCSLQCQHVPEGLTYIRTLQAAARSDSPSQSGCIRSADNKGRPESPHATQAAIHMVSSTVCSLLSAFHISFSSVALEQSNLIT